MADNNNQTNSVKLIVFKSLTGQLTSHTFKACVGLSFA